MMKFTLGLFAILAIIGLGQSHQFPDFGEGPLHEDMQDFLDLVPIEKVFDIVVDYVLNDDEIQGILNYLSESSLIKDLLVDLEAIPEVINFFDYLHNHDIKIYEGINAINREVGIKELIPPPRTISTMTRSERCGLVGLFKDLAELFDYDDYITLYVTKMKTSPAFVDFINQIKSNNFQQIVNKFYVTKSFQTVLTGLHTFGVKTKIVADIMYFVFGLTIPGNTKTLVQELMDFVKLVPVDKMYEIVTKYLNEDEKVKNAFLFLFTTEFHTLLRNVEALKEHEAMVIFLEKTGLPVIESIQKFHESIGMEKYIPPKIEALLKSKIQVHEVGEGMKAMLKDLYDVLPLDDIDALYQDKLKISKVFFNFINAVTSKDFQEIITNLYNHDTYQEFLVKTREQGLELQGLTELANRIFGIKFPSLFYSLFALF